jgi:hypothetical protein
LPDITVVGGRKSHGYSANWLIRPRIIERCLYMVINVIITSYYSVTFFKKYKKIGEKGHSNVRNGEKKKILVSSLQP